MSTYSHWKFLKNEDTKASRIGCALFHAREQVFRFARGNILIDTLDCIGLGSSGRFPNARNTVKDMTTHAEDNAIQYAVASVSGSRAYLTMDPCNSCARRFLSANIELRSLQRSSKFFVTDQLHRGSKAIILKSFELLQEIQELLRIAFMPDHVLRFFRATYYTQLLPSSFLPFEDTELSKFIYASLTGEIERMKPIEFFSPDAEVQKVSFHIDYLIAIALQSVRDGLANIDF